MERWRKRSQADRLLPPGPAVADAGDRRGRRRAGSACARRPRPPPAGRGRLDRAIRMTNPQFYGRDDKGRVLRAHRRARRCATPATPTRSSWTAPGCCSTPAAGEPMRVTGGARRLSRGDQGAAARRRRAAAGRPRHRPRPAPRPWSTPRPASCAAKRASPATGPLGQISASSYGVYDGGARIVFKGGVRSRIVQE